MSVDWLQPDTTIVKRLLSAKWFPRIDILRHGRINVQKPRAPHYERAKYLEMLKPTFKEDESAYLPPSVKCRKSQELVQYKLKVDNPLEKIIAKEIFEKFESSSVIGFLDTNPVKEDNFQSYHSERGLGSGVVSVTTLVGLQLGLVTEDDLDCFVYYKEHIQNQPTKIVELTEDT